MKDFKFVVRYNKEKHVYELFKCYRRKWTLSEFKYRDVSVENPDVVIDYQLAGPNEFSEDLFKNLEQADIYSNSRDIFYFVFYNLETVGIRTEGVKYEDLCALIESYTEEDLLAFVEEVNSIHAKEREARKNEARAKAEERTL